MSALSILNGKQDEWLRALRGPDQTPRAEQPLRQRKRGGRGRQESGIPERPDLALISPSEARTAVDLLRYNSLAQFVL